MVLVKDELGWASLQMGYADSEIQIFHKDGRLYTDAVVLSCYLLDKKSDNEVRGVELNVATQSGWSELKEGEGNEWLYVFKKYEQGKETSNYAIQNGFLFRTRMTDGEDSL